MFVPFTPFKVLFKKKIWDVICVDSDTETILAKVRPKQEIPQKHKDEDDIAEEEKARMEQIQITTTRLLLGRKNRPLIWEDLENVKFIGTNVQQLPR